MKDFIERVIEFASEPSDPDEPYNDSIEAYEDAEAQKERLAAVIRILWDRLTPEQQTKAKRVLRSYAKEKTP